jgi:flagellar protein FliO/FliZ
MRHTQKFFTVASTVLASALVSTVACASTAGAPTTATPAASIGASIGVGSAVTTPSIWPVLIALGVVVAAIVLFGMFMKKLNPASAQSGKLLRVVSQLPVGPKERVVVVSFQSQWLVLGVTAQQVNLLSTSDIPAGNEQNTDTTATPAFAKWLQNALKPSSSNPAQSGSN